MWLFGESINLMSMGGSRWRSAWSSTMRWWSWRTFIAACARDRRYGDRACDAGVDRADCRIDAHHRGRVRAARLALRRRRPILPGVVADASAAVLVSLVLSLTLIPLLARAFSPKNTPHRPHRPARARLLVDAAAMAAHPVCRP
jgi:hypothetical protein